MHFTRRQIGIVAFREMKLLPCCLKGFCSQREARREDAPVTSAFPPGWAWSLLQSLPRSAESIWQQLICPSALHTSEAGYVASATLKLGDERECCNIYLSFWMQLELPSCATANYKAGICPVSCFLNLFGLLLKWNVHTKRNNQLKSSILICCGWSYMLSYLLCLFLTHVSLMERRKNALRASYLRTWSSFINVFHAQCLH